MMRIESQRSALIYNRRNSASATKARNNKKSSFMYEPETQAGAVSHRTILPFEQNEGNGQSETMP